MTQEGEETEAGKIVEFEAPERRRQAGENPLRYK